MYCFDPIQKGLIIAPTEEVYAITENDLAIPWDICCNFLCKIYFCIIRNDKINFYKNY